MSHHPAAFRSATSRSNSATSWSMLDPRVAVGIRAGTSVLSLRCNEGRLRARFSALAIAMATMTLFASVPVGCACAHSSPPVSGQSSHEGCHEGRTEDQHRPRSHHSNEQHHGSSGDSCISCAPHPSAEASSAGLTDPGGPVHALQSLLWGVVATPPTASRMARLWRPPPLRATPLRIKCVLIV